MAQKVQTVIFRKKSSPADVNGGKGWTRATASSWLTGHGFKAGKVDEPPGGDTLRYRQFDPGLCKGGFQTLTKNFPKGVSAVSCERPSESALDEQHQTIELGSYLGTAELAADTINEEERTVDAIFYSGAPVLRIPFFDEPYELQFEMSEKAVKLERLNSGGPVIDSHSSRFRGVEAILGVVEKAWLATGKARATLRFSKRAGVEPIWQDVLDGVIRSVSMGAYLYELKEVTKKGAKLKRFLATSWEPYEVSLVAVPADAGAVIQASDDEHGETRPCQVFYSAEALADAQMGDIMQIKIRLLAKCELGECGEIVEIDEKDFDATLHSKELEAPTDPPPVPPVDPNAQATAMVDAAIRHDNEHTAEVRRVAAHFGLDRVWAQKHISLGSDVQVVLAEAAEERAKRAPKVASDIGFGDDRDSAVWRRERMEEAMVARARRQAPPDAAAQYAEMGFVDMALECLGFHRLHRGLHVRRDAERIIELALHSTSDFPLLLGNALNKMLLPAYEAAAPTYRGLGAQKTFNDFRAHSFLRKGDFPVPLQVNEHGEFKYGTMGENREQVTAATYGRILGLSRQTMINDDLGAFEDIATTAGQRIADFENATFFTVCILAGSGMGPDLSDSIAVYNSSHSNVTGAGALSDTLLDSGRALMMAQTSIDGIKLNIVPTILLVSPTSLGLAERLTAPLSALIGQGADAAPVPNINPWAGKLIPVADANLTGTRFYMLANADRLPNYIWGYLTGATGPRTQVREGFEVDGVEFKVALDFGCGAIDYRGGATGAGA